MTSKVFITHSSLDKGSALILVERLRTRGVDVWIDHEQIRPGNPILARIAEGLSASDVVLVLISKNSNDSPWCRKEYQIVLQKEIVSGTTKVIPILLDECSIPILLSDKKYLRFSEIEIWISELIETLGVGEELVASVPVGPEPIQFPPSSVEALAFLLLLDQFPLGVWGRSLVKSAAAYGHAEDPGSITVSQWAVSALKAVHPSVDLPEVKTFTKYLLERRRPETGAIGMRKPIGSIFAPQYEIVENRRHTAVGAMYLLKHANALDLALESLRYLIQYRTEHGGWVAIGEPVEKNADPLTTGYVLSVLRFFERENLLQSIHINNRDLFLARYWKAGLLWLYENLLENNGWWIYQTKGAEPAPEALRRTYCYTTDILLALPEFWAEDSDYERVHEELLTRLEKIWVETGRGIPSGPGEAAPCLESTVQFAMTCWKCRARYQDLNLRVSRRFLEDFQYVMEQGNSDAAGWALTITYLVSMLESVVPAQVNTHALRELTVDVTKEYKHDSGLRGSSVPSGWPDWALKIASSKILPVVITPP